MELAMVGLGRLNKEPISLVTQVCAANGWQPTQIRFYTGIPDKSDNPFWNHFWTASFTFRFRRSVRHALSLPRACR